MIIMIITSIIIIYDSNIDWSGYIGKSYRRSIPTIPWNGSHNSLTCHKTELNIVITNTWFVIVRDT